MDQIRTFVCEVYPWFSVVTSEEVRDHYYSIIEPTISDKEVFDSFWKGIPESMWPDRSKIEYLWLMNLISY